MSKLTLEIACEVPRTLGAQLAYDHQSQSPLNPDIALYASIAVIRSLGVYSGSLIQVSQTRAAHDVQLARIYPHVNEDIGHKQHAGASSKEQVLLSPLLAHNLAVQPMLGLQSAGDSSEPQCGPQVRLAAAAPPSSSSTQASSDQWICPQPGKKSAAVAKASVVKFARIRSPELVLWKHTAQQSPAPQDSAAGAISEADSPERPSKVQGVKDTETAAMHGAAEGLKQYLLQHRLILQKGDIVAAPEMAPGAGSGALTTLFDDKSRQQGTSQSLHLFKVVDAQPEGKGPLLVDVAETTVGLEGSCSARLPVGLQRYRASLHDTLRPQSLHRPASSTAVPAGHDENTQESASSAVTANGNLAEEAEPAGQRDEQRLALEGVLGWDASAPRQADCSLPGVSPLMPIWRTVAAMLAPLFHQDAARVAMRSGVLLHGPPGVGKATAVHAAAKALGLHVVPFGCADLHSMGEQQVVNRLRDAHEAACAFAPAVLLLKAVECLAGSGAAEESRSPGSQEAETLHLAGALSDITQLPAVTDELAEGRVAVVGCCSHVSSLPAPLRRCFTHEVHLEAPTTAERASLLQGMLAGQAGAVEAGLQEVASQTAGLMPADLAALVADAGSAALLQDADLQSYLQAPATSRHDLWDAAPGAISQDHLQQALGGLRERAASALGTPQVPDVRWEDVGGLAEVKAAILETIELPLKHPHLFASGLRRRSGILLYGPPGTGKTLMAKAVATECSINFLSVKGPELINMYIGESERQVREVFERARQARPCIIFFDELDSLAPARGAGADSGGVMDRVVAQLLAELDGMQGSSDTSSSGSGSGADSNDIFIIGATNRPDLLDTALMRPGRLDRLLYVGTSGDTASRAAVLQALTRRFALAPDVDLAAVSRECAATFTGADLYALAADAWMLALKRLAAQTDQDPPAGTDDAAAQAEGNDEVVVGQADFWGALRNLSPSLSAAELQRYEALRSQFEAK